MQPITKNTVKEILIRQQKPIFEIDIFEALGYDRWNHPDHHKTRGVTDLDRAIEKALGYRPTPTDPVSKETRKLLARLRETLQRMCERGECEKEPAGQDNLFRYTHVCVLHHPAHLRVMTVPATMTNCSLVVQPGRVMKFIKAKEGQGLLEIAAGHGKGIRSYFAPNQYRDYDGLS